MHNTSTYGAWESVTPVPPSCSYLYSLPPIGVGTGAVESFTSYITRLAAAHTVEAGALVNTELLRRVPCTKGVSRGDVPTKMPTAFFISAFPLNGIGERARAWVTVLERLTGVRGLDLLTLLPWSKAISCVHLLRTQRAWCPYCYGQPGLADQQVYDRLLWTLQVVTACPVHGCPLESICPLCTKEQYVFAPRMRPGDCSRCQAWLGRAAQPTSGDRDESVQIAEMAGELLAASSHVPMGFGLDQFQENMRAFRRCRQFHSVIARRNARGWMNAGSAPRIDSLVLVSQCQNISMLHLLTEPIAVEPRIVSHPPHAHYRVDGPSVEAALQAALREDVPPPLAEIAAQVGYLCAESLRFRFRDLCRAIVRKRSANLKLFPVPVAVPIPRALIERSLSDALAKGDPISLSSLAESVGLRNKRRLYKGFHDLRKAVVANNRQHRAQRAAAIEGALRTALAEAPLPSLTDVAKRLGLKSTCALTRRFPDLSTELKRRRQVELNNATRASNAPASEPFARGTTRPRRGARLPAV